MAIRLDQGDLIVATCSTQTAVSLYASEQKQGGNTERDFLTADPITLLPTETRPLPLTEETANELGSSFAEPLLEPGTFLSVSMALTGGGSRSSSFLIPEDGLSETMWLTPQDTEVSDPCG